MKITDPETLNRLLHRRTKSGLTVQEEIELDAKKRLKADVGLGESKKKQKNGYDPKIVLAFFAEHGIPLPELEYRFHPDRLWRFDFAWTSEKICLAVEGLGGRHQTNAGFTGDIEKYSEAALLDWLLIRTTVRDLCMTETIDNLKRAFQLRRSQSSVEAAVKLCICGAFQKIEQGPTD